MKLQYHIINFNDNNLLSGRIDELQAIINSSLKTNNIKPSDILCIEAYTDISSLDDYSYCKQQMGLALKKVGQGKTPAYYLFPQVTGDGESKFVITYQEGVDNQIEHKIFQKHNYTICNTSSGKILFSGQIDFNEQNDPLRSTQLVYDFMEQLLDHEEMHFGHMIQCNTCIDQIFLSDKYDGMDAWQLLDQVQNLYFDPTLFKNNYPSLGTSSMLTAGISGQFIAAVKDSFPIHQAFVLNNNIQVENSVQIPDWNQILIAGVDSSSSSDEQADNIISQTKACVNFLQKLLSVDSDYELEYLKIFLKDFNDYEDTKLIIEQQLSSNNYLFILSDKADPQRLIKIETTGTLK